MDHYVTRKIVFEEFNKGAKYEQNKYSQKLKEIDKKIKQFEIRYVEGEINKELYDKYSQKYIEEKRKTEQIMNNSTFESSNLLNC